MRLVMRVTSSGHVFVRTSGVLGLLYKHKHAMKDHVEELVIKITVVQ